MAKQQKRKKDRKYSERESDQGQMCRNGYNNEGTVSSSHLQKIRKAYQYLHFCHTYASNSVFMRAELITITACNIYLLH